MVDAPRMVGSSCGCLTGGRCGRCLTTICTAAAAERSCSRGSCLRGCAAARAAGCRWCSHARTPQATMTVTAVSSSWLLGRQGRRGGPGRLRGVPTASHIAHAGLAFAHPVSEAAVDAAIAALRLPANPLVLDTGRGNGEILLRTMKLHAPARGLGVDLDPDAIAEARQRAHGISARFEVRDAPLTEGRFNAALNVASSLAHGGVPAALKALTGRPGTNRSVRRGVLAPAPVAGFSRRQCWGRQCGTLVPPRL